MKRDRALQGMRGACQSIALFAMLCVGCGASDEVGRRDRMPCDPQLTERSVEVPTERTLAATCGNARIEEYDASCVERCEGGCAGPVTCATHCSSVSEPCDGDALGGSDCVRAGFGRGALSCAIDCSAIDVRACDPCVDLRCREIQLPLATAAGSDLEMLTVGRGASRRARAFWSGEEGLLYSAVVDVESRMLGDVVALGAPFERWPVATTTGAFLAAVGSDEGLELVVLDDSGVHRRPLGLPLDVGEVRAFSRPDGAGAIFTQGALGSNEVRVVLVDAGGRSLRWPTEAVIGIHPLERLVVAPMPPGSLTVDVGASSLDVRSVRGDRLLVVASGECEIDGGTCTTLAALLHDGVAFPAIGDTWENGGDHVAVVASTCASELGRDLRCSESATVSAPRGQPMMSITFTRAGIELDGRTAWTAPEPVATTAFAPVVPPETITASGDLYAAVFDVDADGPAPARALIALPLD